MIPAYLQKKRDAGAYLVKRLFFPDNRDRAAFGNK